MCGLAGWFDPSRGAPDEARLRRMLGLLRHRGPDGFGIYRGRGVGLAHARLSIIDLETGQQPMCNEDGSLWIVFNGEIFNYVELRGDLLRRGHRFSSSSDTEVILHLYEDKGVEALADLNGQFAFALWDARKREILLARDRMGIRPLFYARHGEEWIFASEIKALFADERLAREIDPVALDDVFTFWTPLSPRTAFVGVRELPPAHWLRVGEGGWTSGRYWDLPEEADARDVHPEKFYAEGLLDLLVDATRIQLRADVPVGAYLSGGLDSSVTAALIRRCAASPLATFSVTFHDPEFDESAKQRVMTEFLRTEHKTVACEEPDIARAFPEVIWHAEVPLLRTAPSPLFLLSRLVRENDCKVVLTGEGADEILAGYDIFKEDKVRRFMAAFPDSRLRPLLLQRLYPYLRQSPTRSLAYARAFFGAPASPFAEQYRSHAPRWNLTAGAKVFFSEDLRRRASAEPAAERVALSFGALPANALGRAQEIEIRTLLPGYILSSQGDRMLMAHSVEGRFPFLDHRVVEFCLRVPPVLRLKALREKYILRRAMAALLPDSILRMVKQPYRAPEARCFLGGDALASELLSPESLAATGFFDPPRVERLTAKLRSTPVSGFKDNMAFVGMLSAQLLHRLFVRDFRAERGPEIHEVRLLDGDARGQPRR
ncbi:MAG: asparagine synthase (glutamine-hydrolyzing) [Planctomycetes bacterium]|nr:asparagine synthase (glutamine-hydrolyzing) [Planctomycetota bacterium]